VSEEGQKYLKTEFNRQGDSYRNPFTNRYEPPNAAGYCPSGMFRAFEENGELLFAEYVKQYYGGETVGNFYVMEAEKGTNSFSCGFFAKKSKLVVILVSHEDSFQGTWDSFNIVDVELRGNQFVYELNSTVIIEMGILEKGINITGFLKKSVLIASLRKRRLAGCKKLPARRNCSSPTSL
jgi:capping protein beta